MKKVIKPYCYTCGLIHLKTDSCVELTIAFNKLRK